MLHLQLLTTFNSDGLHPVFQQRTGQDVQFQVWCKYSNFFFFVWQFQSVTIDSGWLWLILNMCLSPKRTQVVVWNVPDSITLLPICNLKLKVHIFINFVQFYSPPSWFHSNSYVYPIIGQCNGHQQIKSRKRTNYNPDRKQTPTQSGMVTLHNGPLCL